MKKLEWNEEYTIRFSLDNKHFSTPKGKGFIAKFDAENEVKRLKAKGAVNIEIYIQKWNG